MNKYEVIGTVLGFAIIGGITAAINEHRRRIMDKEIAEAEQRANEGMEEIRNCIKTIDELNRDLSMLLNN